jgi:hypothetical protein
MGGGYQDQYETEEPAPAGINYQQRAAGALQVFAVSRAALAATRIDILPAHQVSNRSGMLVDNLNVFKLIAWLSSLVCYNNLAPSHADTSISRQPFQHRATYSLQYAQSHRGRDRLTERQCRFRRAQPS